MSSKDTLNDRSMPLRPLSESLERRIASYALAASAAGVALLVTAQPAKANSIVYDRLNETLSSPGNLSLSIGDTTFRFDGDFDISYTFKSTQGGNEVFAVPDVDISVVNGSFLVGSGAVIGPSNPYRRSVSGGIGTFWLAFIRTSMPARASSYFYEGGYFFFNRSFLGLKFNLHGQPHYGWLSYSLKPTLATAPDGHLLPFPELTLSAIAWNRQPNAPILVGQTSNHSVPEPATLALLAIGAAALPFWRKKHNSTHRQTERTR